MAIVGGRFLPAFALAYHSSAGLCARLASRAALLRALLTRRNPHGGDSAFGIEKRAKFHKSLKNSPAWGEKMRNLHCIA